VCHGTEVTRGRAGGEFVLQHQLAHGEAHALGRTLARPMTATNILSITFLVIGRGVGFSGGLLDMPGGRVEMEDVTVLDRESLE